MPVYKVTTPDGFKVVDAVSQRDAIEHALSEHYTAESLSAPALAALIKSGSTIETTEKRAGSVEEDDGQTDIEDFADEQETHEPIARIA